MNKSLVRYFSIIVILICYNQLHAQHLTLNEFAFPIFTEKYKPDIIYLLNDTHTKLYQFPFRNSDKFAIPDNAEINQLTDTIQATILEYDSLGRIVHYAIFNTPKDSSKIYTDTISEAFYRYNSLDKISWVKLKKVAYGNSTPFLYKKYYNIFEYNMFFNAYGHLIKYEINVSRTDTNATFKSQKLEYLYNYDVLGRPIFKQLRWNDSDYYLSYHRFFYNKSELMPNEIKEYIINKYNGKCDTINESTSFDINWTLKSFDPASYGKLYDERDSSNQYKFSYFDTTKYLLCRNYWSHNSKERYFMRQDDQYDMNHNLLNSYLADTPCVFTVFGDITKTYSYINPHFLSYSYNKNRRLISRVEYTSMTTGDCGDNSTTINYNKYVYVYLKDSDRNEYYFTIPDEYKSTLINSAFLIYPNPNNGTFTINFNNTAGEKQIAIYNLQGKLIAHYTTNDNVFEVQELLLHGMYFIKTETQQGAINTKFFVE